MARKAKATGPRTRFTELERTPEGGFRGLENRPGWGDEPIRFSASFELFLIREAWDRGCDFESLADGFGGGLGTMGGDWSGIRDSSDPAKLAMLERALNFLFA